MAVISRFLLTASVSVACAVLATSTAVWLSARAIDWFLQLHPGGNAFDHDEDRTDEHTNTTSQESHRDKGVERTIVVPAACIGMVIGRGGRTLRQIEYETQTVLDFRALSSRNDTRSGDSLVAGCDDRVATPDSGNHPQPDGVLLIRGATSRQVELAEMAVRAIIADSSRPQLVDYLDIPSEAVGYLIGRHGASIRAINDRCRVAIRVSQNGGDIEEAVIRGSDDGVRMAKELINQRLHSYFLKFAPRPSANDDPDEDGDLDPLLTRSPQEHLEHCRQVLAMVNCEADDEVW